MNVYDIGETKGIKWIRCNACGRISYNVNDIEHKYCGHCHVFHEAGTGTRSVVVPLEAKDYIDYLMNGGQAEGAIPNGTRVEKVKSDPDDGHQDGDTATVRGSISTFENRYLYAVEFDDVPGVKIVIISSRIGVLNEQEG